MSYGAGHALDAINRMKQNRKLRPSKCIKFKENNRETIYSTDRKSNKPNYKTVPEKELNEIKARIRNRAKIERKKELILYGISFVFVLILMISIWVWVI